MAHFLVGVRYDGGYQNYNFRYEGEVGDLANGDKVVVDSKRGLGIATVVSAIRLAEGEKFDRQVTAWVIQKIDMAAHEERLVRAKKAERLLKQMETRKEQIMEAQVYSTLAQSDPTMAALLMEYQRVTN